MSFTLQESQKKRKKVMKLMKYDNIEAAVITLHIPDD